ncbi:MAG: endonuclease [Bacteroidales bacterium]|nr:endonuclease [Bacteroidales bacterium]
MMYTTDFFNKRPAHRPAMRGREVQRVNSCLFAVIMMLAVLIPSGMQAQAPATYYNSAYGKSGKALKTELHEIIKSGYVTKSYDFLYTIYEESDTRPDGKLWDMYSTCTWTHGQKKCGNYSTVCDCYNREHSIPQSWFNERSPMVSDAHHIYPTDGRVNGQRGNDPFGECANGTTLTNGLGRSGSSTFPGYSGRVFEPVDEYKGDFARTYFYFVTRYEDLMSTFSTSSTSFSGNAYPSLNSWSIALFLKWHRQDPVSEKEIVRNNAVYKHQKNRNAFIDHPILAEHIWGTLQGSAWDVTGVETPAELLARVNYNANERSMMVAADLGELSYEVVNISGVRLLSGTLLGGDAVSMGSLKPGVYFFRANADTLKAVKKFIVQ